MDKVLAVFKVIRSGVSEFCEAVDVLVHDPGDLAAESGTAQRKGGNKFFTPLRTSLVGSCLFPLLGLIGAGLAVEVGDGDGLVTTEKGVEWGLVGLQKGITQ